MLGNLVLHMQISRDFRHQVNHMVIPLTSLPAPSGAKMDCHYSVKDRILTPTCQTDTIVVSSATLIMGPTIITEEAERISTMTTGTMMAGAMTMMAEGTVVEVGSGPPLATSSHSKDVVYRAILGPFHQVVLEIFLKLYRVAPQFSTCL